jgi:hypothetical protein
MKIYLLDDPAQPTKFAHFSHLGTWVDDRVCSVCGESTARLVEPLQIEWEEGATRIGDFSWCGYTCIVTGEVSEYLMHKMGDCRFGKVDVLPPAGPSSMPRIGFPYCGPQLFWLIATARVRIDEGASKVEQQSDCPVCGQKRFTFKREGLVIPSAAWRGERLFSIDQFGRSSAKFVTEDGLEILRREEFSNLAPKFAGVISVAQ